ncbi:MAG: glycosyltransferase [archaeon]
MIWIYPILYVVLFVTMCFLYTFFENKEHKNPGGKCTEKVSILVPAYNEEEGIARLLDSLLDLDYKNKEIVVIDDGSKDKTYEIASKYKRRGVKVFKKENGGKANALNYGLKHCTGEFIFTIDADCVVDKKTLKKMVRFFKNPEVMAVVPSLRVYKPRKIIERVQAVEYIITSFNRKMLSFMQALNVVPGAPMYRASFFRKHGKFDETTMTEDLEMGMRMQSKGYKIDFAWDAPVLTKVPKTMVSLFRQRRRWGYGFLENFMKYRKMVGLKYGELGLFYLPAMFFFAVYPGIFLVYLISWLFEKSVTSAYYLSAVNYDVAYAVTTGTMEFLLNPRFFLLVCSVIMGLTVYYLAKTHIKERKFKIDYIAYALVYGWVLALFQLFVLLIFILRRKPKW